MLHTKRMLCQKEIEAFDACSYDNQWKSPDFDRSKWLNPLGAYNQSRDNKLINNPFERKLCTIRHIMTPIDVYREQRVFITTLARYSREHQE